MKKNTQDRILSLLRAAEGRAFKTKELARELGLPKQGNEYQGLKEALRVLQQEGRIVRLKNSRWMVPMAKTEATPGEGPSAETASADQTYWDVAAEGAAPSAERLVVGVFKEFRRLCYVEPDDRDIEGDIAVARKSSGAAEDGDKVVVRLLPARGRSAGLEGEVVEVLGKRGRADVEMLALARRFGLSLEFPGDVDEQAFAIPSKLSEADLAGRWDLRDLECFTIDPEDARDFDDAVSLTTGADGNHELGVHIADVSHYVTEGSPLDREAFRRGTSVYLVDGVFPMLPERLSNHMCSLKEGKDRLTFSVFVTLSPRGAVKDYRIGKSVIRSNRRFTYEEVQALLDGASQDGASQAAESPHAETLHAMERLARILMKKRFREGSVDFNVPEVKFVLDATGAPQDIIPKQRLMSMRLVEEFMLLANRVVAQHVAEGAPAGGSAAVGGKRGEGRAAARPFIYRVHDLPDPEKVRELLEFLRHLGVKVQLDASSSRSFQEMIEQLRDRPEEAVVQDVTIRSMAKAVYSEENIGHFGLGFRYYTHFTSPIRRYPDLVVHRLLQAYAEGTGAAPSRKRLADIARQSSIRERLAVEAERESVKIKQVEYMKRHEGDHFDAVVSGVTRYGLYVEIYPTLVEGLVHVRGMDDYFEFDKARLQLVGQRSGRRYRLGDHVRVQVVRVDSTEMQIDFTLVEDAEDEGREDGLPRRSPAKRNESGKGGRTGGRKGGGTEGRKGGGTEGRKGGSAEGRKGGGTEGRKGGGRKDGKPRRRSSGGGRR